MGIEIRRDVVKKKDKRLPDRVGMIVSGPPELFSNDVMDRLALAGFRKTKPRNESYKEVWRLNATVGATPDHLLRTLSSVAHVSGDPAVERAVDMGTRPSSGTGAGAADLSVKVLGPFFCANCEFDNKPRRAFLEGAGFFPLFQPGVPGKDVIIKAFGDFPYVSQDGIIAANLLPWMDAAAKTALLDRMKEEKMRIARSGVKQRIKGDPVIPMPEGEALQGFQDAGVNNLLRTRKSGVIYDDMGLGKTVQGVAYANSRPDLPRILVCCKANMKYGWKTAFERFGVQPRNAFIIEGASATIVDPKTKEERSATPTPEMLVPVGVPITEQTQDMVSLVIINYDILTHHADFIRNTQWDLVIQDEIHSVSNEEAQRTRIIFGDMKDKVKKPIGLRLTKDGVSIGLSGTPHPVVERMWPILSGLRPDVFGTGPYAKRLFIQRYAPPTLFVKEFPNGGKRVLAIPGRPIRQAELNRRLRGSGFMTRRLKADMKDFLPPKTRAAIELPFTLTEEETKELAQLEGQIVEVVAKVAERSADREAQVKNEGRASAIIDVVKGLHPKSPEFHEISRLRSRIGEIKAPYVAEYVMEETDGEEDLPADIRPKTVIFAHHKAVIGAIRAALETKYPGQVIVYDGSVTSDKKRFDLEKRFQTDDKIRFFVMSLSGASGITLTRANRLYMAEMDWDPTNLPQIEDRIWRMTQELPCFIGYFMVPNSLDVQMGNRLIQRMEDNRLIYDEIDLRPGVKPKKTDSGFTKVKSKVDERQGTLPL